MKGPVFALLLFPQSSTTWLAFKKLSSMHWISAMQAATSFCSPGTGSVLCVSSQRKIRVSWAENEQRSKSYTP